MYIYIPDEPANYAPRQYSNTTSPSSSATACQPESPPQYNPSHGPRACIGRNISYFEHILAVGTIARIFGNGLSDELVTIERFDGNPGEVFGRLKRRVDLQQEYMVYV